MKNTSKPKFKTTVLYSRGLRKQIKTSSNNSRVMMRAPTKPVVAPVSGMRLVNREHLFKLRADATSSYRKQFVFNPRKLIWGLAPSLAYDTYHPNSITFHYIPRCATTTPGRIIMFIDYDPTDDNGSIEPDNLAAMSGAVVDSVYKSVSVSYKPSATVLAQHRYFCSDATTPDRLADCCRLWVCVEGGPSPTVECGEIYVQYDISLYNPELGPNPMACSLAVSNSKAGTGNATNPLGNLADIVTTSTKFATTTQQGINLLKNVCSNGACFADVTTAASADMDMVSHPDFSSYSADGSLVTQSTVDALWPTSPIIVFKTDTDNVLVLLQLQYHYTAASAADTPGVQVAFNNTDWQLDMNTIHYGNQFQAGVPAAKIGVSTPIYQLWTARFKRIHPSRGFWMQCRLTGTSIGTVNDAFVNDLTISPFPCLLKKELY